MGNAGNGQEMLERQELTSYLMWLIWKARNSWTFKSESQTKNEIVKKAWGEWMEFKGDQIQKAWTNNRIEVGEMREVWQCRGAGEVKINVSSHCEGDGGEVGLGLIALNHIVATLQVWSVTRDRVHCPVVVDVEAVRMALLVAQ